MTPATEETEVLIIELYKQKLLTRDQLIDYVGQVAAIENQMQYCLMDLDAVYSEALSTAMKRPKVIIKGRE